MNQIVCALSPVTMHVPFICHNRNKIIMWLYVYYIQYLHLNCHAMVEWLEQHAQWFVGNIQHCSGIPDMV